MSKQIKKIEIGFVGDPFSDKPFYADRATVPEVIRVTVEDDDEEIEINPWLVSSELGDLIERIKTKI